MPSAFIVFAMAIGFFISSGSWAQTSDPAYPRSGVSSARAESQNYGAYGATATLLGDPGLSAIGINFLHELDPNVRFRAGIGTLFDFGWTLGTGIDYRFNAGSRFRPVVGLEIDYTHIRDHWFSIVENKDSPLGFDFRDEDRSYNLVYSALKIGAEYQAPSGFLVGLTMMGICGVALDNSGSGGCALDPIPSLRIGTMF